MTTNQPSSRTALWVCIFAVLAIGIVSATAVGAWKLMNTHVAAAAQAHDANPADDPAKRSAVMDAAKSNTVKVLTYKTDTLAADFEAAKAVMTGDFLIYYERFTREVVTPAAQQKHVSTTAQAVAAAVESLSADKANVLVFVNQTTTSTDNPEGALASSSVRLGLVKVNEQWLIEKFDPV